MIRTYTAPSAQSWLLQAHRQTCPHRAEECRREAALAQQHHDYMAELDRIRREGAWMAWEVSAAHPAIVRGRCGFGRPA